MKTLSIKTRASLAVAAMLVVVLGASSALQIRSLRGDFTRVLSDQQYTLAQRTAHDIDSKFETGVAALASTAMFLDESALADVAGMRAGFQRHPAIMALFDDLLVIDAKGLVIADYPEVPGRVGVDSSDRQYFKQVASTLSAAISEPQLGKTRREPIVQIGVPIFSRKGAFAGVLVGVIRLYRPNFLGALGDEKIGERGYFVVITREAHPVYVVHPDRTRILQERNPKGPAAIGRAIAGFEGTDQGTSSVGSDNLYSSRLLRRVPWVLIAAAPKDEVFAPLAAAERRIWIVMAVAVLAVMPLAWLLTRILLTPLQRLRAAMVGARAGSSAGFSTVPVARDDEVGDLTTAFNLLMRERHSLEEAQREGAARLQALAGELELLASSDALTGLPNRRSFEYLLPQAIARSGRDGRWLALLYVDLDRFKAVNDTLGHGAGDDVLKAVAARLLESVRNSDTVARLAGDEFAVILEGLNAPDDATPVAAKIVAAVAVPILTRAGPSSIGASVGIAACANGALDPEALEKRADAAAYAAKNAGRGRYHMAEPEAGAAGAIIRA